MDKSLSDSDIRSLGIPNVILYEDLKNMDPRTLLSKLPLVVLYQNDKDIGHWVMLHRTPEGFEFFDSLGYMPDKEFEFLKMKQPHYIAKMLYDLSQVEKINYNPHVLQVDKPGVATCGRHCVVRHMFSGYGIDDYARSIKAVSNKLNITPDELVTKLT
jgi:hypothetical protein